MLTHLASQLLLPAISLNKQPGVRPIAISEIAHRIIGKAILSVTKSDIQSAVGSLQVCADQDAGVEDAVHAMRIILRVRVLTEFNWWTQVMHSVV